MTCAQHPHCSPAVRPDSCPWCHASWRKITAPAATRVTTRKFTDKSGTRMVEDVAYLSGYGETPLAHIWKHASAEAGVPATGRRRQVSSATPGVAASGNTAPRAECCSRQIAVGDTELNANLGTTLVACIANVRAAASTSRVLRTRQLPHQWAQAFATDSGGV